MLLPVRTFLHSKKIQRRRLLPVSGKVFVRKGQTVSASEVIAEAILEARYQYLDLGLGLGVAADKVESYLQVKAGSKIEAGDLIAGPVGSARRVVRAPEACAVLGLEGGQVLMEFAGTPYSLAAGYPGSVVALVADRGAVVESSGVLLQGAWGNGRWGQGSLAILAKTPQHVLSPSQLNASLKGALVLAGHCETREALAQAVDVSIGGLVLSSLNPAVIEMAVSIPFPVMVLEGFGKHPFNTSLFQALAELQPVEAILNTEKNLLYQQTSPELLIPVPAGQELSLEQGMREAAVGDRVRVATSLYLGKSGTLVKVGESTRLPNGIWAETGILRLDSGDSLCLPLVNLEIIE